MIRRKSLYFALAPGVVMLASTGMAGATGMAISAAETSGLAARGKRA